MMTNLPHYCVRGCSVDIIYADILRKVPDSNKDVGINRNINMLVKLLKFCSRIYPYYANIWLSRKLLK